MIMKKILICLACCAFAPAGMAAVQLGIDANLDVHPVVQTSDPGNPNVTNHTTTNTSLGLEPYIGIRLGKIVEFDPSVFIGDSSGSTKTEFSNGNPTTSFSSWQVGLGFGGAFLFHVLQNERLQLSLGPKLTTKWWLPPSSTPDVNYAQYYNMIVDLSLPIAFDFYFNDRVGLRTSVRAVGFNYMVHSIKVEGGNPDVVHNIDFNILTNWSPTLGFFFVF
jgi:hypothetical protein